jgi:tetratricopeptide (TPR) repeat protein
MNLLARRSEWTRPEKDRAAATPSAGGYQHYFAFISYSHRDAQVADWLQEELEGFKVPMQLVGRITKHGSIPRRLTPVFRDLEELPASDDLGTEIHEAISTSRFLIVLCSPESAKSRWTNAEIEAFKLAHPEGFMLAAIVAGEPFASDDPAHEAEECLPRALRFKYDRRGRITDKRAEPLAADLRGSAENRRMGFLKLVAGMLDVGLDDLVRRDAVRRQRRLALLAAASLAGMIVTSGLAITAIEARDAARDQRREAEGLISFMLGDLQQKLQPIGRLDALDGVGARVLDYYKKQDKTDLSDSALKQRSQALALMGAVANSRGNLDASMRLYQEAIAGTAEAIRRNPQDPERYYDHAQNVFYTADIALRRGDAKAALAALEEYKSLSDKEVALAPDSMKYRMEAQNATVNLGSMMYTHRRFPEAAAQFEQALRSMDAFATADPQNEEYQKSLIETLAWSADAHFAVGRLNQATTERERHVALLERLLKQSRGDVYYGEKLITAHRALARLYAYRGRLDLAIAQAREAAAHSEQLLAVERNNSEWLEYSAQARFVLAQFYLASGKRPEAASEVDAGCAIAQPLYARDPKLSDWRILRGSCLVAKANLDLASGSAASALTNANQALQIARSTKNSDPLEDGYAVAKAYRIAGDAQRLLGKGAAANEAWTQALAAVPRTAAERPTEMSEHALILKRLGRSAESAQLAGKLSAMGYREPEFRIG